MTNPPIILILHPEFMTRYARRNGLRYAEDIDNILAELGGDDA